MSIITEPERETAAPKLETAETAVASGAAEGETERKLGRREVISIISGLALAMFLAR